MQKNDIYFKIAAALSFFLPLTIYVFTLCPATYTQDTGEFITAAYTLGVPHPPGYPVYCLLGKLFTFIPLNGIAWRVNFMSAFWGAAAVFLLFLLIQRLCKKTEISFASACIFAASGVFWSQCVTAEVYSLNVFFLALCLYLLQLWREDKKDKYLCAVSFVYGLSICNHHFMTLAGPFFVLFVLWSDTSIFKKSKLIFSCIGLFVLGLVPYIYLPIASRFNPALDWGNPETFERFIAHIQRKTYGDINLEGLDFSNKAKFIKFFFSQFKEQFGLPLIVIGIAGFFALLKKDIKFFVLSAGVFIFNGMLLIFMQQQPFSVNRAEVNAVYYLPCYFMFACFLAQGFLFLRDWLGCALRPHLFKLLAAAIILFFIIFQFLNNFHKNDLSKNYIVYDFVKSAMNLLDKDAVIFVDGDAVMFNILYFQQVERYRKDIKMYDGAGYLANEYLGQDIIFGRVTEDELNNRKREVCNKIIDENYGKRAIYFNYYFNLGPLSKYALKPFNLVLKVVKKGEKVDPRLIPISKVYLRNVDDEKLYKDYFIKEILSLYWNAMAVYYDEMKDMKNARHAYEEKAKYKLDF